MIYRLVRRTVCSHRFVRRRRSTVSYTQGVSHDGIDLSLFIPGKFAEVIMLLSRFYK